MDTLFTVVLLIAGWCCVACVGFYGALSNTVHMQFRKKIAEESIRKGRVPNAKATSWMLGDVRIVSAIIGLMGARYCNPHAVAAYRWIVKYCLLAGNPTAGRLGRCGGILEEQLNSRD